jgi:sugar (pentulose or hexulose) kinase
MLFLGIDIGTTNIKAAILSSEMDRHYFKTLPSPLIGPEGRVDPMEWVEKVREILRWACRFGEDLVCSLASQTNSFVFLDASGQSVSPGFSWTYEVPQQAYADFHEIMSDADFYAMTGWLPNGAMMAFKLHAFRRRYPEYFQQAKYIAAIPEFISSALFGQLLTDVTSAQITGLYDFQRGQWSTTMLQWLGIEPQALAKVLPPPQIYYEGRFEDRVRLQMATGAHDQYAAMLGSGLTRATILLATGSAWVLAGKTKSPLMNPPDYTIHPGCDLLGDGYGFLYILGQQGLEFQRLLEGCGRSWGDLPELEKDPSGEIRQFMEHAAVQVHRAIEHCESQGMSFKKIIMTGGAAQSSICPQIIADVCELSTEAIPLGELTACGAAFNAMSAAAVPVFHDRRSQFLNSHLVEP